jgi:hypothetical protein
LKCVCALFIGMEGVKSIREIKNSFDISSFEQHNTTEATYVSFYAYP